MRHPTSRRSFITAGSLGFLGLSLREALSAAAAAPANGKAKAVILFWLEGGPSHIDTWDPKTNSNFKPISTNVAGIQISELLPKMAKRMDKFALVRSMHTCGTDHPQATHYAITGHEINPAMQFPSLGSIITKELVRATPCPRTCWFPSGTAPDNTKNTFGPHFWAAITTPCASPWNTP